ncbi:MAG: nuclear transport factor 2 family protein [Acidobacteriota bacterium]
MKTVVWCFTLLLFYLCIACQPQANSAVTPPASELKQPIQPDETAIKQDITKVLDEQAAGWNEGSIDKYMEGYEKSDSVRFASGGNVTYGWQTVLDRYKKGYADKAAMGRLTFSEIDIKVLKEDTALVFGRWLLERAKDQPQGLFTLLFRKTSAGWRIVHDHTSAKQ